MLSYFLSVFSTNHFIVLISDFVEACRNIFQEELEDLGLGSDPFTFSYHEAASLMDTSAFHSPVSFSQTLSDHHQDQAYG